MIAQMVMQGYPLVALLVGAGIVLMIGETLLPTHGLLAIAAVIALLAAVAVSARENVWAGVGMMLALAAATPLAWSAFVKLWPRTPVGRRMVLPEIQSDAPPPPVRVGQSGRAVSELRPMGTCDFDGTRVEAMSEHGIVPAGAAVRIVALVNNRPTVRAGN
jgi:membrane-bound serine protease (ClpP class)